MQVPVLCGQEKYSYFLFAVMKTQWEQFNYVDGKQKETIIHTSGRQNAVDMISLSLPIPRYSLEVSLGAISPTSPSNVTVELLARLLNNNTNAKCLFIGVGDGVARSHH